MTSDEMSDAQQDSEEGCPKSRMSSSELEDFTEGVVAEIRRNTMLIQHLKKCIEEKERDLSHLEHLLMLAREAPSLLDVLEDALKRDPIE